MDAILKECSLYFADCQSVCLKALKTCLHRGGKFTDAALCTSLADGAQACVAAWRAVCEGSLSAEQALCCARACDRASRCCDRMVDGELARAARALRACAERAAEAAERVERLELQAQVEGGGAVGEAPHRDPLRAQLP